jgi:hypothetical protein
VKLINRQQEGRNDYQLIGFQFEDLRGDSAGSDDFDLDAVSGVDVTLCCGHEHFFNN